MDFVKALMDGMSNNSINLISQKTGENPERTRAGILAAIPTVLAGVMKNATTGGEGFLHNLIPGLSADKTTNLAEPDLQDSESLMSRGKSMLGSLFGNDTAAVSNAVADSSGISREKSSGLLAMAVPVIMAGITRMMSSNGWGITDLVRNLFESKSEIASSLPGNLGSTMGLASLNTPDLSRFGSVASGIPASAAAGAKAFTSAAKVPPLRTAEIDRPVSTGMGFLKWLIPLIILALVAWWLLGRKGKENANVTATTDTITTQADTSSMAGTVAAAAAGSLNAAGDWVYNLGPTIQVKLPNGTEISVGENSAENRLVNFIKDDSKAVDKTTWFSLDRLYFETGKSTLKQGSRQQLENIAAIMKAYPKVKIKLGGYTDNTGDTAANKRLSTSRAETARKDLSNLGVAADRLEAEGYGAEHPVASNDTKEGRAQNRRIDIRVTAK